MKTIKVYFYSLILILLFVGCNTDKQENEGLSATTDPTAEDVQDNSQDNQENDNKDEMPVDSQDETVAETEADEEAVDTEEMEGGVGTTSYEGEILDLTPPDDEDVYTSGLVIIKQEEDYWRAVDRQGNVYRISTSTELTPGMVIEETYVSLDDNGDRFVELTSGYTTYEDTIISQRGFSQASQEIARKLFEQYSLGQTLESANHIENIGSGIKRYGIDVTLENGEKTTFEFTLYGYEDTWLMPSASNLNNRMKIDTNGEANNESDKESDMVRREEIYDYDEVVYYQEHELLPQSNLTQGTEIYEYMTNIYAEDGSGKRQLIHKGGRNSYYETLKQFGQRVYLKANGWEPFSEEYSAGIGFLDLTDNTYKVLYNGPIIEGMMRDDTFYFFADDKLLELSLGTAKYNSVTTLPHSINDNVFLEVISVNASTMRISIENGSVKKYEINLKESTIKEYNE
jgi:hypothetical protein